MIDKRKRSLFALLLVLALLVSLPAGRALAAEDDDPVGGSGAGAGTTEENPMPLTGLSLKVDPDLLKYAAEDANPKDSEAANTLVQIELYQIAGAAADSAHGLTYVFTDPLVDFASGGKTIDITKYSTEAANTLALIDLTATEWAAMAQTAATALKNGTISVTHTATSQTEGATFTDLDGGLYLVIARGKDMTKDEYLNSDDPNNIYTIANTGVFEYRFAPALVALPGNGTTSTAGGGWLKDNEVKLKNEQVYRYVDLELKKTLLHIETSNHATFVYHVIAYDETGENLVYDNYHSISFNKDGSVTENTKIVEGTASKIKVGYKVTVIEEYDGACYKPAGTTKYENVTVPAPPEGSNIARTFEFTNDFDGTQTNGYGLENHFKYVVTEDGGTTTQEWVFTGCEDPAGGTSK
ncbi:MAG: hypothetical protein IKQ10_06740 [Oscillospiraceae bacterium]|nr:hypothetical protein [Oscillospiraceae bacterium]